MYFYRRRLRIHGVQELLAGAGVAVAVALVFAVTVANSSIESSARSVVRAVVGPADLQLHAQGPDGIDEHLLRRVEHLPGVSHAAGLLELPATVVGPRGRRTTVDIAGADLGLALIDGLAHTLPVEALSPGGIGLTQTTASELSLPRYNAGRAPIGVSLQLRGRSIATRVSAVLGHEAAGALADARIVVMPLFRLQQISGLRGRVSRILVVSRPGQHDTVRRELTALSAGRAAVAPADQDVSLLRAALRPSNQATTLFAGLSALLGFLFAFNATLLTVPERREAIADMRLDGTPRSGIVQLVLFQALCLGVVASTVGLLMGLLFSTVLFHESPAYLTKAFTLGTGTVIGPRAVLLALTGGIGATLLASLIPLRDLRRGQALDAVFSGSDAPAAAVRRNLLWLLAATVGLVSLASAVSALDPSAAIIACVVLAAATVLAVPVALAAVLRTAGAISRLLPGLTFLPLATSALKATSARALALAATGAVALFGSVALASSRDDLLRGINDFTANYVSAADIWVVNPSDNQAIGDFASTRALARLSAVPGVAAVSTFQGSFLDFGTRRVWIIAWPSASRPSLLENQIIAGDQASADASLRGIGAITVSAQIAAEHHVGVGESLFIPTPSGPAKFRIAATTTNFGWIPGAIVLSTRDYARLWGTSAPSALGVGVGPLADTATVREAIIQTLGPSSGLEVLSAADRRATIERSANEGLAQLADISGLLIAAAVLAMAAALISSLWQRRLSLAELRLEGASSRQVRRVLLAESSMLLTAGCLTGAAVGILGQIAIDDYLKHVTGFPVASPSTGFRPVEIFALVLASVLLAIVVPGWRVSRVPATVALSE